MIEVHDKAANSAVTMFPALSRFAKETGIPEANLVKAFEIERAFHHRVLQEPDARTRERLCKEVYEQVHTLYGKSPSRAAAAPNPKRQLVRGFKRELRGKSILEVGCGSGALLLGVAEQLEHKRLVGIDISTPVLPDDTRSVRFVSGSVIDFELGEQFDVVFSDNVLEHIAPADLGAHLGSVRRALRPGGLFIVLTPNRHFGPSDVTRIIDDSCSNRVPAEGTHLNETSYSELIPVLEAHGFGEFKSLVPLPKFKYWLPVRLSPKCITAIERHPFLLNLLHHLKWRGRCIARFDVMLVCRKLDADPQ